MTFNIYLHFISWVYLVYAIISFHNTLTSHHISSLNCNFIPFGFPTYLFYFNQLISFVHLDIHYIIIGLLMSISIPISITSIWFIHTNLQTEYAYDMFLAYIYTLPFLYTLSLFGYFQYIFYLEYFLNLFKGIPMFIFILNISHGHLCHIIIFF